MNKIEFKGVSVIKQIGVVPYGTVFQYPKGIELYMKTDAQTAIGNHGRFVAVQLKNGRTYNLAPETEIIPLEYDTVLKITANVGGCC